MTWGSQTDGDGRRRWRRDSRASSHAIGFLLLLGLSLSTIAGGAYYGLAGLQDASSGAPAKTAESSLATVRGDFYSLADGSPYRSTPIELYESSVRYGDTVEIRVSASSPSQSLGTQQYEFRPIIIESAGNQYIYSGGVVLRATEDGAYLKTGPRFRIDDEDAYLPVFAMSVADPDREVSVNDRGTAQLAMYKRDSSLTRFEPTDGSGNEETATVTIEVRTPRAEAWASYFRDNPDYSSVSVGPNGKTVTAEFATKHLYLREVTVETKFDD